MLQPAIITFSREIRTVHEAIPSGDGGPPSSLDCTSDDYQFLRMMVQSTKRVQVSERAQTRVSWIELVLRPSGPKKPLTACIG